MTPPALCRPRTRLMKRLLLIWLLYSLIRCSTCAWSSSVFSYSLFLRDSSRAERHCDRGGPSRLPRCPAGPQPTPKHREMRGRLHGVASARLALSSAVPGTLS